MAKTQTLNVPKNGTTTETPPAGMNFLTADGSFFVPMRKVVTGRSFNVVSDLLTKMEKEALAVTINAESFPLYVAMSSGDVEDEEKFVTENIAGLTREIVKLAGFVNREKVGGVSVEQRRIERTYTYLIARESFDLSGLPADQRSLVESDPASDAWQDQDMEEVRRVARDFRTRCSL